MLQDINVIVIVDVVQALSKKTLEDNVYMMDTSPKSKHQASDQLITACHPNQVIRWEFRAVDVQTRFEVTDISIYRRDGRRLLDEDYRCSKLYSDQRWVGRVCLADGLYPYAITMRLGNGRDSEMVLETVALRVRSRTSRCCSRQRSCCWEPPAICPPYAPYGAYTPFAGYYPPYSATCSPLLPQAPLPPGCPPHYPDCGPSREPGWGYCPCDPHPYGSGCGWDSCGCWGEPWDSDLASQSWSHRRPSWLLPPAQSDPEEAP